MLDFIFIGSAELFRTAREQKSQNENINVSSGCKTHATPLYDRLIGALERSDTTLWIMICGYNF